MSSHQEEFNIEKEQVALEKRLTSQIEAIDFAQALSRESEKRTDGLFKEDQLEFLEDIKTEFLRFLDSEEARAWLPKVNEGSEVDALVQSFSRLIKYYLREWPLEEVEAYFNQQNTQELFKGFLIYYAGNIATGLDYTSSYNQALEIGKQTHFHNPERILGLKQKYPEVQPGILQYFAVHNPKDPEAAVERMLETADSLKQKYPEVRPGILQRLAVHNPKDLEAAVERMLNDYKAIKEMDKYKDFPPATMQSLIAENPTNPQYALDDYLNKHPIRKK